LINDLPPSFNSTNIFEDLASIEFSINSLTIDAGRSITSPAAILFINDSSSIFIEIFIPRFKIYYVFKKKVFFLLN
jgi:hypothetical protein